MTTISIGKDVEQGNPHTVPVAMKVVIILWENILAFLPKLSIHICSDPAIPQGHQEVCSATVRTAVFLIAPN